MDLDDWFGQLSEQWFLATELYDALLSEDLDAFRHALKKGANPNTILPEFDMSIVHMICTHKCSPYPDQFLNCLMENCDVDLNQQTSNGLTPLALSIHHGRLSLANQLLDAGADIRQMDLCIDNYCLESGHRRRHLDKDQWKGKSRTLSFDIVKNVHRLKDIIERKPNLQVVYPYHGTKYAIPHHNNLSNVSNRNNNFTSKQSNNVDRKEISQNCPNHNAEREQLTDNVIESIQKALKLKLFRNRNQLSNCKNKGERCMTTKDENIQKEMDHMIETQVQLDDLGKGDQISNRTLYNMNQKPGTERDPVNYIDFMSNIQTDDFKSYLSNMIFCHRASCQVYEANFSNKKSKLCV